MPTSDENFNEVVMQNPGGRFQPADLEMTQELDVSGLDEASAAKLRSSVFGKRMVNPIIESIIGIDPNNTAAFIQATWSKWGQWPQRIGGLTAANRPFENKLETLTRHYKLAGGDEPK